ncbi:MAG: response regulator transcription factor [Bacteroidota bacterium]|jgi:DNA-binding NarL/FixJ family response regulator
MKAQHIKGRKNTSGKPVRIWIIEDNALFRKNIVALINDEKGMSCTGEFSSCEQALQQLVRDERPDAFLLDIGLPGMDGIEGIKKIKILVPDAQIIIITVFDDNDHVFDAICAGASGYLLKTTSEAMILQSIREVISGGSPMNASIARKVLTAFSTLRIPNAEYKLSPREREILDLVIKSYTNQQIAEQLYLSVHTIDTHLRNIYEKLQVHSRTEAVAKILQHQ